MSPISRRVRSVSGFLVLGLAVAMGSVAAQASPREVKSSICIDRTDLEAALKLEFRVPVGCALVDCCPGCPGVDPLDWSVRIAGKAIESVEIRFTGLPEDSPVTVAGSARATDSGAVLRPGETRLGNLRSPISGRAPMAEVVVRLDEEVLRAFAHRDQGGADEPSYIEVRIEQLRGPVVVNEWHLQSALTRCFKPELCDSVKLLSNSGDDRSVVVLDGRRKGLCVDDAVHRGTLATPVGNVEEAGACNSEVSVYSKGDRMTMSAPETSWTDACGDEVSVDLGDRLKVPLAVWVAFPGKKAQVAADIASVNQLYDLNKVGLSFHQVGGEVLTGDIATAVLLAGGCVAAPTLENLGIYVKDRINVYYSAILWNGENCDDRNVIFVSGFANPTTLAHELGHAFSLHGGAAQGAHTNDMSGFTKKNIMQGGGEPLRDHFSLGQMFRFNVDKKSQVNVNPVPNRPGPQRDCPALTTNATCPALRLDWLRP